jgi:PAS domain-containing protein
MLETELFALLERTADAAFCVTEQGEIQSWNKAAEKLFGYSRSQALNKTCYQLLEALVPWARGSAISIAVLPNVPGTMWRSPILI